MSGYTEFVTATGCTVRIYPTGEAKSEGYGGVWTEPGALMVWRMDQPGDGRTVEVGRSRGICDSERFGGADTHRRGHNGGAHLLEHHDRF